VLEAAYNDAAGVTAKFNRNILRVLNRGLGADFRPEEFRHHAWYNAPESRIEMHLVCDTPQTVRVRSLDLTVRSAREHLDGELLQVHASVDARHARGRRAGSRRPAQTRPSALALALAVPRSRAA
jgi:L-histidine N-alpha-methyltransferase